MRRVAIIGGGPAGLMAAEVLAAAQSNFPNATTIEKTAFPTVDRLEVAIFDAMPSVGRKFLIAGKGGMNITHSEALSDFKRRYGERETQLSPLLDAFGPAQLRAWIHDLGIETFVGTSGRVFPTEMKAAPLLRAWLHRLRTQGVHFHVRHRWLGWTPAGDLRFATPAGEVSITADAVILALGGGSWAKLGSDGTWAPLLAERGVPVAPLQPSNCGFDVAWSAHFSQRFAGQPVKSVIASVAGRTQQGEFNITASGIEGGLIYALSAPLRDTLATTGRAELRLDLAPGRSLERLTADLSRPQGRDSLANHLRRRVAIDGVKAGLLREFCPPAALTAASSLAAVIKSLPLPVTATRPLDEAISSAGGVVFAGLDSQLMLRNLPGIFCAGEMLNRVYGAHHLPSIPIHAPLAAFTLIKWDMDLLEVTNGIFRQVRYMRNIARADHCLKRQDSESTWQFSSMAAMLPACLNSLVSVGVRAFRWPVLGAILRRLRLRIPFNPRDQKTKEHP